MIILDLDNTISDDEWRISQIDWETTNPTARYHDYHCLSAFDELKNAHLFEREGRNIAIITSRPNLYRAVTKEWLKRKGVPFQHLMMRPVGNTCGSALLKRELVLQLLNDTSAQPEDITMAYDDREEVINMYKGLGIKAHLAVINHR